MSNTCINVISPNCIIFVLARPETQGEQVPWICPGWPGKITSNPDARNYFQNSVIFSKLQGYFYDFRRFLVRKQCHFLSKVGFYDVQYNICSRFSRNAKLKNDVSTVISYPVRRLVMLKSAERWMFHAMTFNLVLVLGFGRVFSLLE